MAHLDVHRFTVFDDVAILHQGRGQVRHAVVTRHTTGDIPSVDHKPWKLRDRGCHWISNSSGSPTKVKMNSKLFQKQRPHVVPFASLAKLVICEMCYQWSGAHGWWKEMPTDSTPQNWTSSSRALFIIVFLQGQTKQSLATRPMRGSHDRHSHGKPLVFRGNLHIMNLQIIPSPVHMQHLVYDSWHVVSSPTSTMVSGVVFLSYFWREKMFFLYGFLYPLFKKRKNEPSKHLGELLFHCWYVDNIYI